MQIKWGGKNSWGGCEGLSVAGWPAPVEQPGWGNRWGRRGQGNFSAGAQLTAGDGLSWNCRPGGQGVDSRDF